MGKTFKDGAYNRDQYKHTTKDKKKKLKSESNKLRKFRDEDLHNDRSPLLREDDPSEDDD
jgi:hypothetical protein